MSKADRLGGSATFDAVAQPIGSRAASFARFAGQDAAGLVAGEPSALPAPQGSRLPVEELAHNPFNPREELKDVVELADSLAARGVRLSLTVVTRAAFLAAHPGHESSLAAAGYVVVDGNRRLAAARLAGLDEVPVHMDDSLAEDADTLLESALVAAIQHRDLEPLEQAQALQRLVEKYGSQKKAATALHESSGWVTQRLALLKLTPELQQAVEEKTLPVEVARRVGQLPWQQQQSAADEALHVRAEKPKRQREVGREPEPVGSAYAVSTPGAVVVEEEPGQDAGEFPMVDIRRLPCVPWHDGKEVAGLILQKMDATQRAILLEHLLAARADG
ncbi:ParB/RepB/Spo0J family partition protein [Streptomyces goshikiensis]